jgi:hypothetical protein
MNGWLVGSALICAGMLALGTGEVAIGSALSGAFDLIAVVSSIVFVGLMDGA